MSDKDEALRLADALDSVVGGALCNQTAAELRRLHAEIIELKAKVDVAESGYHAAVQKAQWQASTNSELNRHMKQKHELRAECDALRAALRAMVGVYGNDYHPTAQEALRKARAALKEANHE